MSTIKKDPAKPQRVFSGAPWESKVGYCRAIRVGPLIAVTGTTSLTDHGEMMGRGDPYTQTRRCFEIIETALKKLGANRSHVIRTRMFVTNIAQWQEVGRAHGEFFAGDPPATTMVEVKALIDPDMLVEVEADAYVPESARL